MNVLFLTCALDNAPPAAASIRFRARYPVRYWPEADLYPDMRRRLSDYDAYIFQKAYTSERSQALLTHFRRLGKLVAFDLCDADWLLSEEHELRLLKALPQCDLAVAPSDALKTWLAQWVTAYVIPDRLDLEEMKPRKSQVDAVSRHPSVVWFGYSHNMGPLEDFWQVIQRNGMALTILSDKLPERWAKRKQVHFVRWTQEGANGEIARHDLAITTKINLYKSDNRHITAVALGVVAVDSPELLESCADPQQRQYIQQVQAQSISEYDVRRSVADWKCLLDTHMQILQRRHVEGTLWDPQ